MKKILLLMIMILGLTSLISCTEEKKYEIYTSVYTLHFITTNIVKDKITVTSIYPPTAEVHDYTPSPKQLIAMSKARLIFYIGQGLEPFIENSVSTTFKDVKCAKITGYESLELVNQNGELIDDVSSDIIDPHIWLDPEALPLITAAILENILSIEDYKQYETEFRTNANELIVKFNNLTEEYKETINNSSKKTIVIDHDAFAYWTYRYGLTRLRIRGDNETADPSSKDFLNIINTASDNNLKYLLASVNESQESLIQQYITSLNKKNPELNAEVLYLNILEVAPGNGKDYFEIMRENLRVLSKALN